MMYLKNWHFCLSAFLKVDSGWNIDNFMSPFFQYSRKEQCIRPWTKSCRIFTLMECKKKKKYFKAPLPSLSLPAFKLFLSDIWFVLISFCFVVAFSCFRGNLINFKMWICYCCFWFWIIFYDSIHGFIFEARSFYLLQRSCLWKICFGIFTSITFL